MHMTKLGSSDSETFHVRTQKRPENARLSTPPRRYVSSSVCSDDELEIPLHSVHLGLYPKISFHNSVVCGFISNTAQIMFYHKSALLTSYQRRNYSPQGRNNREKRTRTAFVTRPGHDIVHVLFQTFLSKMRCEQETKTQI